MRGGDRYGAAMLALDRVHGLRHQRAETVFDAVTAVLGWVGARRAHAAGSGDPVQVGIRRIIGLAADLEFAASILASTPCRSETIALRREAWGEVLVRAARVRSAMEGERAARPSAVAERREAAG